MSTPDARGAASGELMPRVTVAMLARSPRATGKTRLTAGLETAGADTLRRALLLDAIEAALAPGWPLRVFVDPAGDAADVRQLIGADTTLAPHAPRVSWDAQHTGDLGTRMTEAMARTIETGCDVVVLIGSDAPDLPAAHLLEAARLAGETSSQGRSRLVLGPAADGGFYLMAARHAEAEAFAGVTWSVPTVFAAVRARAEVAGREVVKVAPWHDVDTPDDLAALLARPSGASRTRAVAGALTWAPPYNRA